MSVFLQYERYAKAGMSGPGPSIGASARLAPEFGSTNPGYTARFVAFEEDSSIIPRFRDPNEINRMIRDVVIFSNTGMYMEAENLGRRVLDIQQTSLGKEHPNTLQSMDNLASVLAEQEKYAESEDLQQRVLKIRQNTLGDEHHDTLLSMNNLGATLRDMGKYAEAEVLHRMALETQKKVLGPIHPETLQSMDHLADTFAVQERFAEVEYLHRELLAIRQTTLGKEHRGTIIAMDNLGATLRDMGKYKEAEDLQRMALKIRQKILGKEHRDTLLSMNNLAATLLDKEEFAQAEELYRFTVQIQQKALGAEHCGTLLSMNNLAAILTRRGAYTEAEGLQRTVLKIRQRALGLQHRDTVLAMNNLGTTLRNKREYKEAEDLHRSALKIRQKILGTEHHDTLISMNHLATTLAFGAGSSEAEDLQRKMAEICQKLGMASLESTHGNQKIKPTLMLRDHEKLVYRSANNSTTPSNRGGIPRSGDTVGPSVPKIHGVDRHNSKDHGAGMGHSQDSGTYKDLCFNTINKDIVANIDLKSDVSRKQQELVEVLDNNASMGRAPGVETELDMRNSKDVSEFRSKASLNETSNRALSKPKVPDSPLIGGPDPQDLSIGSSYDSISDQSSHMHIIDEESAIGERYAESRKRQIIDRVVLFVTELLRSRFSEARKTASPGESEMATNGGSFGSCNEPASQRSLGKSLKRKAVEEAESDYDGGHNDDPGNSQPGDASGKGKAVEKPKYACPYFKHNPTKYKEWRSCPGPGWLTVHRLK
jgi:tetratricopeptide (TPR) repeat protein